MSYSPASPTNQSPEGLHVLIADTIEQDYDTAAMNAAGVHTALAGQPALAIEAMASAKSVLEDPHNTIDKLEALDLDQQRQHIAYGVATLLHNTEHGRYIFFSETVYDSLDNDEQHSKLIRQVQKADRRNGDLLARSHRQLVISGLMAVARLHLAEQSTAETAEDRNDVA